MGDKLLRINTQLLPYLTPEAKALLKGLEQQGIDRDLALAMLEHELPEESIYCLEEDDQG